MKYTQSTPRITGSLKCQNLFEEGGGGNFAPVVVPAMLLKLLDSTVQEEKTRHSAQSPAQLRRVLASSSS